MLQNSNYVHNKTKKISFCHVIYICVHNVYNFMNFY